VKDYFKDWTPVTDINIETLVATGDTEEVMKMDKPPKNLPDLNRGMQPVPPEPSSD
jgi:hypothetical protein